MSDKLVDMASEYQAVKESTSSKEVVQLEGSSLKEAIRKEYERRMDELRPILLIIERPLDLTDEGFRRAVFPKLSFGLRKAGELVAYIKYHYKVAVDSGKRAKAIAFLEAFDDYAQAREIKSTDKAREFYIPLNKDVQLANNAEAVLEAYLENAMTIKQELIMSLSTIKGMVYGMRDSDLLSSSAS
ncbi:MAG: hypothetical protein QXL01_07805 [Thermoplasmatales archaeon]